MKRYHFISDYVGAAALVVGLFYLALGSVFSWPARETAASPMGGEIRLIIDPGHGGEDGGAVSVTGKRESELNLEISRRCEDLAAFMGCGTVMTRYSEEIEYPAEATTTRARKVADQRARVELVNSYENAVLLSIHQNMYTAPSPSGAQAFYNGGRGAAELAAGIQADLLRYVNEDDKRTAKPVSEDIYLMNSVECPAVLVECGFLSNPGEAAKLEQSSHQKLLSMIIIGEFMNYFG